jgi:hypothetical protein
MLQAQRCKHNAADIGRRARSGDTDDRERKGRTVTEIPDRPDENAGTGNTDSGASPGSVPMYGSWVEPSEPTAAPEQADPDVPPPLPPYDPAPVPTPPPYGTPAAYPELSGTPGRNAVPDYGTPVPSGKVIPGPSGYPPEYGTPEYTAAQQRIPAYAPYTPVPPPTDSTALVSATILLVVSIVSLFSCFFTLSGVVGTVIAVIALIQGQSNPAGAKKMAIGGWIAFGVTALLLAVFFGLAAAVD